MALEDLFPALGGSGWTGSSPATLRYNCLAWAAGVDDAWWEPDPEGDCFWPDGVPRERTLEAVAKAYESLGFSPCPDETHERGFEKIALYALDDLPTHAARQLSSGRWTSKLGPLEDIEHALPGLVGAEYGTVVLILKRPIPSP